MTSHNQEHNFWKQRVSKEVTEQTKCLDDKILRGSQSEFYSSPIRKKIDLESLTKYQQFYKIFIIVL